MLIAHLHLLLRLIISEAVPHFSLYAFKVWKGTTLPFYLISSLRIQIFTAVTDQMMGFFSVSPPVLFLCHCTAISLQSILICSTHGAMTANILHHKSQVSQCKGEGT